MYTRKHVDEKAKYWKPGEPLTKRDMRILHPIIRKAGELGRSPTKSDVKDIGRIKGRFRTWEIALRAAGLPSLLDKEQQRLRDEERRKLRHGDHKEE
jgi:hypothetical protein